MRLFGALFVGVSFATLAFSTSPVTIPLTKVKRIEAYLGGRVPVEAAHARRAAFLKSPTPSGLTAVPLTNQASFYTTSVDIGHPPASYNLLIDTGSPLIFCGAGKPYNRTSTSITTGQSVNASYGSGGFTGLEYLDRVAVAPNLVITNQLISDAISSFGFNVTGLDGILGLSPVNLTKGVLSPERNATIPTVMNNLASQGLIEKQIFSIYFTPSTNISDPDPPVLTYGGIDPSLFEGELTYTPVTTTYPAAWYWGINVTMCTYGNETIIPRSTAGIVDTGTSQFMFSEDFLNTYMKAIPGAKYNSSLSIIEIPPESIKSMHSLNFVIAGRAFTLDVQAQLIPQSENVAWGGEPERRYIAVGSLGDHSGEGLDFLLGLQFMQRYYAVFDADDNRIGFAQTKNTFSPYPCE